MKDEADPSADVLFLLRYNFDIKTLHFQEIFNEFLLNISSDYCGPIFMKFETLDGGQNLLGLKDWNQIPVTNMKKKF